MSSTNALPRKSGTKRSEYPGSWNYSGSIFWTYPVVAESSIRSTFELETPPLKDSDSNSHSESASSEPEQQHYIQPSSLYSLHSSSTSGNATSGPSTSPSHPVPPATQTDSSSSNEAPFSVIGTYVYTSKYMINSTLTPSFRPTPPATTQPSSNSDTPKLITFKDPHFLIEGDFDRNFPYTEEHYSVRKLLKIAESTGSIQSTGGTDSDIAVALAALSVFTKPDLRAHWVFWDHVSQSETARIVDQVYANARHCITFPHPWDLNYSYHALRELEGMHRAAHNRLLDKAWYFEVMSPTRREVVVYAQRLQKKQDQEARRKQAKPKPRKRKAPKLGSRKRTKRAATAAPQHNDVDPADDTVPDSAPKVGNKRGRKAAVPADSSAAPQTPTSPPDESRPKIPLRTSARIKKLQEESGTLTTPTATAAPGPSTSPSPEDPTLRSTSGASSKTVVATPDPKSRSRSLSAQTAVGAIDKSKGKGKEIEFDEGIDVVGDLDSKLMPPPPVPSRVRTRAATVVPSPLITRSRARAVELANQSAAPPLPPPSEKTTRAKSRSNTSATPYPKGKEAQIASGRGKGKKAKKP